MLTIFWDARGVLYVEFLTKGSKVNSDRYCATLRSLKKRIRRIRSKKKHVYFASRQRKATLQCTNSGRHEKPEIHSGSTPSLQPRFGTVRLLFVPKIKGDFKRSTFFIRMPKLRQLCVNESAANQKLSS